MKATKKPAKISLYFSLLFFVLPLFIQQQLLQAQESEPLIKNGDKILFVGNSTVGSEGGLQNHFRRVAARARPRLEIEADWIAMYGMNTLNDMYTDELVERIKTGDDSTIIVSDGSPDAMQKFVELINEVGKQMILFSTWANNPQTETGGMQQFRDKTIENLTRVKKFEKESGVPVVPSGLIFYDLTVDPIPFPGLRKDYLFVPGSSVQNDLGTLVNVSAIYAVVTGKSPVGLWFWDPFDPELVRGVQERVWEIVQAWKAGKAEVKELTATHAWEPLVKDGDHIFYVGNSFIGTEGGLENHFPRMTAQMQPPLNLHTKSQIFWGQGLQRMYTDGVVEEIKTGENNLVVVTSGPTDYMQKFYKTISDAGKKMMIHMTWATNPTLREGDLTRYNEQITRMVEQMKSFEKETGVPIAPCGLVFYDLIVDPPNLPLRLRSDWVYMVENIHQNHIGTMANAATHYAVMTGKSPVGLQMWDPYPPELVKAVQERAWQIVQDWKAGKTVIKPVPDELPEQYRQPQRRREVSWVNPDITKMEGLTHHILNSKALGHDVGYAVWTPQEYDKNKNKHYPVIYFLHGMGGNESADAAGFSGWVQSAINDGLLPPVICVFPNGGVSMYRGEVEKMIIDELIPFIDNNYRTINDAGSRALAGFSMGGAGSVYLSVMHPELFCAAGSMGGGMWMWNDKTDKKLEEAIPVWKKNNLGFMLVNGDQDRPDAYDKLTAVLNKNNIENKVIILPDTEHNLGRYYELSVNKILGFIGEHLKK